MTSTNKRQWHRWFAWYPVLMRGNLTWLKFVERRKITFEDLDGCIDAFGPLSSFWTYRPVEVDDDSFEVYDGVGMFLNS